VKLRGEAVAGVWSLQRGQAIGLQILDNDDVIRSFRFRAVGVRRFVLRFFIRRWDVIEPGRVRLVAARDAVLPLNSSFELENGLPNFLIGLIVVQVVVPLHGKRVKLFGWQFPTFRARYPPDTIPDW